jgi:Polyketide cyclase / dehydrase and lipid transport
MRTIRVAADGAVAAPAAVVYGLLADYRQHHSQVLPSAFSEWAVEEGGIGTGTVVRFVISAGGRQRAYRMAVTEPEPGRVLTESDIGSSLVTTFTVDSTGPQSARVRIETTWQGAGGVGGFFERRFAPVALRRIYAEELVKLDIYARQQSGAPGAGGDHPSRGEAAT